MEEKSGCLFIVTTGTILLLLYILITTIRTILPIVSEDEYYETTWKYKKEGWEFITIHSKDCPYKKNRWFKEKRKKYDVLIKKNASICNECIDEDEAKKMIVLHYFNLEKIRKFQARYGYDENLTEYNTEASINNVYYFEDF